MTRNRKSQRARPAFPGLVDSSQVDLPLIVGIGASTGGLDALVQLLQRLRDVEGLALVYLQHADPFLNGEWIETVRGKSTLPIVELSGRTKLRAGYLHLAPANSVLEVEDAVIHIAKGNHQDHPAAPIDHFLHSLAKDQAERSIGIILSGPGSDGSLGLKAISDHGGLTFAKDLTSAAFDSMPRSAAITGNADYVLHPNEIAFELTRYRDHLLAIHAGPLQIATREDVTHAIPDIAERLLQVTHHNFQHYKTNTLSRRIHRRMRVLKLGDAEQYLQLLKSNDDEVHLLFRELLIGVTTFFRDPDVFDALYEMVLPKLFEGRSADDTIRIWVAGCASGEEAYSLAILCKEYMDTLENPPHVRIFATDLDQRALQIARQGIYTVGIENHVSIERLKRLSCRNLMIYLGSHLQNKLIPLFHYAVRPAGYLLLGPSENIVSHGDLFRPLHNKFRIFQRKGTAIGTSASLTYRSGGLAAVGDAEPQFDHGVDLTKLMQKIILDDFAPKSVVVDESGQVLVASSDMQKYLSINSGRFQNNIIKLAKSGLRIGLRATLSEAKLKRRKIQHHNLSVRVGDAIQQVMLTVRPMPDVGEDLGIFLVVFLDVGLPVILDEVDDRVSGDGISGDRDADSIIAQMERELETAREDL